MQARRIVKSVIAWTLLTLAWAVFVVLVAGQLRAQEMNPYQRWIHEHNPACCDHRDCRPASVEWTPDGWKVEGADNLIPEKLAIPWPFPLPYACVINRHARCVFVSSGG